MATYKKIDLPKDKLLPARSMCFPPPAERRDDSNSFSFEPQLFQTYAAQHLDPQGPGNARPTAMQVIEDERLNLKLHGEVVLVTGGDEGTGLEVAKALHATGADVFITTEDGA